MFIYELIIHSFMFTAMVEFLDFTIQIGNINDWYRKLIIKTFYKPKENEPTLLEQDKWHYMEQNINSKWFKVLCGCKFCYQFWLSIFYLFFLWELKYLVIFASVNYLFFKLYRKL